MPNYPEYAADPILRRLADLERAVEEIRTSTGLRSAAVTDEAGAVRLRVGRVGSLFGAVLYNAAGEQQVVLDENGLAAYDAAGAQTVMLDENGLTIDGGTARALDVVSATTSFQNVTVTTVATAFASLTLPRPTWATGAVVLATLHFQVTNAGGSPFNYIFDVRVDGTSGGTREATIAAGETQAFYNSSTPSLTGLTGDVTVDARLTVNSGTSTLNAGVLSALAIYLR